ncbi:MAG: MFS transporter [Levilactobacillus sp.]|jgi:MFS family permease|uniref:MFS transporter n=1 Tax=Levilactobacillus suantsaiihabitans TaxID=2487722 RepID=A0A4Z0JB71_9LACO|nr:MULTISPECIES: MFS transporter [Levilactobacillus]MCI1554338.1 MFS transporter [Levilactobacillus sp.]MCI1599245.1 MFS transporter [Levilactobacillus sp.]MCI1605757.1 MFS transporter [Levilactobacillus sp.]TGD18394.1 MFS transporter [Levilactobacillus suantsaiihabitans]
METTTQDHALNTHQKWTIASTSAGFALENMDVMFLSFALSSIIADLHISGAQAGLISSITNLGMLVGGVLFGILADRFGRVRTFSHTIFIFAFATAAMGFASNITWIYVFRFLAGVGAGGEYGVGITLIAESFSRDKIGKMTSVAAIGGQIGAILAAVAAAFIIPALGWKALFVLGLVPVALTYFIRRHLHESDEFLAAKQAPRDQQKPVQIRALFKTPKLAYQTVALMIMVIVQIAGYFGLMNWLPAIMQQKLGLTVSGSSVWMIATIVGMSIGMMTFGSILDYFGPRRAFGIFLIASAIAVFSITLAFNQLTLVLAGAIIGFFSNGMFGGYGAVISRLYPTEIRSTANNVIVNVGRAIGGFSSVAIGFLMDHYTLTVVMGFLSVLYIISFTVMLTIPSLRKMGVVNED